MIKHSLLIVEDDLQLKRALTVNLEARNYQVASTTTGADGMKILNTTPPDVLILDLGLPDIDGVDLILEIRQSSHIPIIVLSARDREVDKVRALDAGADDYVTKPFGIDELLARLRVVLRRTDQSESPAKSIRTEDFEIDFDKLVVTNGAGEPIKLTKIEWGIMEFLATSPGKLFTTKQILTHVWGAAYAEDSQTLRVHVSQLRRKLEPEPSSPRYLITELGMGYRLVIE
ncbi:KDP operon transcriptional regulatory protein KdpE [mine drainage metagenome]|uniref:KDP operon transcriptional regulatory protein KdpE n=1 Tax=mine drainage metagenome TaxID=410659 RepID=A0A1J5QAM5_9ZZZZ